MPSVLALAALLGSFSPALQARETAVVFEPAADTYLRRGTPNVSHGGSPELEVKSSPSNNRVLVRFDLAEIAATLGQGTLISAELELWVETNGGGWGTSGRAVDMHRVNMPWTEAGATWYCADDEVPMNNHPDCSPGWGGGSVEPEVVASALHTDALLGPVRFDLTQELAALLAGGEHLGWSIERGAGVTSGTVYYASREGTPARAPRLIVVYEPTGDFEPPVLTVSSPVDGARLSSSPEMVEVAYLDNGSGVDLSSLRIILDDLDLTSSCDVGSVAAACRMFVLQVGVHEVAAEVRDVAGNLASVGSSFAVVPPFAPPVVAINSPQPGALTNAESLVVGGQVFTVGTIAELEVNGQPTVLDGDRFGLEIPVEEGFFLIAVRALDTEGRETVEQVEIVVDQTAPELRLSQPSEQQLSNVAEIQVRGTAEDDLGFVEVEVQGAPVEVDVVAFEATVSLAEGANEITVTAIDPAGNATTRVVVATYEPSLSVTITEPLEQSHQITQTVTVRGSVAGEPTQVTVAGVPAELVGNAFSAQVPLSLGSNPIAVLARDARGHVGKAVATVVRDATPPRIAFTAPLDGQKVFVPTLDVAGLVNDVIGTTVPAGQRFDVTINGVAARVEGETFVLEGIGLQPGSNVLTAEVVDASGNRGETSIMVDYAVLAVPRLLRVSGSGQAGTIGTRLPEALVVRAVDENEQPVGGIPVVFRVLEGSGQLDGGKRQALVFTDGGGHASIGFTLGTRAGLGNHVVEAGAVGFAGEARFLLEAQPGLPARLVVDTGDQQIGITGQRLPQPLVAIAVDSAFNPLPGVPVTLRVSAGEGYFENGLDVLELTTNAQGRAAASLVLGMQEGKANTAVVARLGRADEEPPAGTPVAAFVASAMAVGSGATSIRGLVLDNTDQPVPGVTLRIAGTDLETTADAAGLFLLENVPGGTLHLEVDGGTATRAGTWPTLEFLLHPIPGRENVLPRPIFLLPLETEGLFVSETEGGMLTVPELPGFELAIAPGSATFRDGSKSGTVAVTVVHADKVPMIPSFSQQPRLVITVQPPGTLFDPPARLTMPNLDGLAPGEVVDFFSFDHDLARFVSIGQAQVSEDGTTIRSKPGFGIIEGGWHCGSNPTGTGTPHECPECAFCLVNICQPIKRCLPCGEAEQGRVCDGEGHCVAGVAVLPKICDQLSVVSSEPEAVPRTDPFIQSRWPDCGPSDCFAAVRLTYHSLTHSCNGADLRGATLAESVRQIGGTCPIPLQTGRGCPVRRGNQLASGRGEGPCTDLFAVCGPPTAVPIGGCTAVYEQTLSVGSCVVQRRTFSFSLPRGENGCGPGIVGFP